MNEILCVDDVCPSNLRYWKYCLEIKDEIPNIRFIAFVIANYKNKEDISKDIDFINWFEENKDWVEIGVHGFDHLYPPEQERIDSEELVYKSINILKPFLKKNFLYRPPGFQRTIKTENILKKLDFGGIAYQNRIKYFDGSIIENNIINCHCCGKFINPLNKWRKWLRL